MRFYMLFFLFVELPVSVGFAAGVYFFHLRVLSFCCNV